MNSARVLALIASTALSIAGLAHSGPFPPEYCTAMSAAESSYHGFVGATLRNAPALVSVIVLRPRRDPMEDIEGFDFFQAVAGLPLGDGAGATQERSNSSG